jgi:hypothetical protein
MGLSAAAAGPVSLTLAAIFALSKPRNPGEPRMSSSSTSSAEVTVGSDRKFGAVFAGFFTIVGLLPLLHGGAIRWWALALAAAFAVVAWLKPHWLHPLNRIWAWIGMVLHHVTNPIVMGVVYYGAFVPVGLAMRAFNKDPLRLKRDPQAASYWIAREPPAPAPGSMTQQF